MIHILIASGVSLLLAGNTLIGAESAGFCYTKERESSLNGAFRLVGEVSKRWPLGSNLRVYFTNGGIADHRRVESVVQDWEDYANISFSFSHQDSSITLQQSDIRIQFTRSVNESYIGTYAQQHPGEVTMKLANRDFDTQLNKGTILHEFGHALGLRHEHQNPNQPFQWNWNGLRAHFPRCTDECSTTCCWTDEDIRNNVVNPYTPSTGDIVTKYDSKSIMIYPVQRNWINNANDVELPVRGNELSETDKTRIGEMYPTYWTPANHGAFGWHIGDFNGDGKDDIFRYVSGESGADMYLSRGDRFVAVGSWTPANNGDFGWHVGDFNGDGKDDIFRYVSGESGADMRLSRGDRFAAVGSWTPANNGDFGWHVGDFNGDGKDDIFRYVSGESGADMYLSRGDRFAAVGSWTPAGNGDFGWHVGDFNGDGMDDIFRYKSGESGADMYLSRGDRFAAVGSWTPAGNGDFGWHVGDFNGDGMDDIFRYKSGESGADMYLSRGDRFAAVGSWTPASNGDFGWHVGDFNGDGTEDIFRYVTGRGGADICLLFEI